VEHQPAHRERDSALWTHLDRDPIRRAADALFTSSFGFTLSSALRNTSSGSSLKRALMMSNEP
jgi:hypothetical protein